MKTVLKTLKLRPIRYWKLAVGEDASQWMAWRSGNFVAIGWDELGDLSRIQRREFEQRRDALLRQFPERTQRSANLVWLFAHQVQPGDRVVVSRNPQEIVGIGTVNGAYYFVPDTYKGHCLPVEWDDLTPRSVDLPGWRRPLVELSTEQFASLRTAPVIVSEQPEVQPRRLAETPVAYVVGSSQPDPDQRATRTNDDRLPAEVVRSEQPLYPLSDLAKQIGYDEEQVARWLRAIERKGQAIFYGPPGVGKTFIAQELARHLMGGSDGFWELVQFHAAYTYEDFIQGLRPRAAAGGYPEFRLEPGRFLTFCRLAEGRSGRCVLIIDEINRANLARVLGELLYLLEYRDQTIPLAGGGRLHIPTNVRILGAMNTADRSIALVDYALRRRFAFIALRPNYELLYRFHTEQRTDFPITALIEQLKRLNQRIADEHYAIGHSFFLRATLAEEIAEIWEMEIEPYLEEFFFDQPATVEEFRWEEVRRGLGCT